MANSTHSSSTTNSTNTRKGAQVISSLRLKAIALTKVILSVTKGVIWAGIVIQNWWWEITSSIKIRWILNVFLLLLLSSTFSPAESPGGQFWFPIMIYAPKVCETKSTTAVGLSGPMSLKLIRSDCKKEATHESEIDWSEPPRSWVVRRSTPRIGPIHKGWL